jgi:hypothetical protein
MPETNDFFNAFIRDTEGVVFEMPAEIRRRGSRRRIHRRVAVAGLAALVVVGIGVGSALALASPENASDVGNGPSTSPTPTSQPPAPPPPLSPSAPASSTRSATNAPTGPPASSSAPASTTIPAAALLRPQDIGTGYTSSDAQEGDDHGAIGMLMSYCGQTGYSDAPEHRVLNRKRSLQQSDQRYLLEEVSRYEAAWAQQHLRDLRAVLPTCRTVDIMANPNDQATLTVVDTDFAGDGAVLVKEVRGTQTQYHAVIRQGDYEARLRIHTGATESTARAIAVKAAQRLCAASPSC